MRKYSLLFLSFASLCSIAAEPRLEFEQPTFDFGEVDQGEKVKASFAFKNSGDGPLDILKVVPTCGCTTAELDKKQYQPGESGIISVTFNTQRFPGKVTKRITVESNDPNRPRTSVTLKGNVTVDIRYAPNSLFFADARMGQSATHEININTGRMANLELSDVEVNIQPECLNARVVQVDATHARLVVTADGSKFPSQKSQINGTLSFQTNSKAQKTIRIPISIRIQRPIATSPRSVYMFASKEGKPREVTVKVRSTDNSNFQILGVESNSEFISITRGKDEGREKYLVATLSGQAELGKFEAEIRVTTDNPEQKEVRIPVRGSVVK